jgi:hypothetical protein
MATELEDIFSRATPASAFPHPLRYRRPPQPRAETLPRWARGDEKQARWARRFQTSRQREAGPL